MDTNERLTVWTNRWALTDGMVVCKFCKNSQFMTEADHSFLHAARCTASSNTDPNPWIELHDALDYERG